MRIHETIALLIAGEGLLLTQASEVAPEERIFSSRVYDNNPDNWVEWTQEEVDEFITQNEKQKVETTKE